MKKLFLLAMAVSFSAMTFAQSEKGGVGLNVGYGTQSDLKKPSIGVKAFYNLGESFTITPTFNYYFQKDLGSYEGIDLKMNVWDANLDLHYNVIRNDYFKLYPLAGVTYMNVKATAEGGGMSESESDGEFGFNVGVGAQFNLGSSFAIIPEVKYQIIKDMEQFVPSVALMYRF